MRLIDADALLRNTVYNTLGAPYITKRDVEEAPTVEAEPVRHGRWLPYKKAPEWDQKVCSVCGDVSCCQRNYCPNCGAKMVDD